VNPWYLLPVAFVFLLRSRPAGASRTGDPPPEPRAGGRVAWPVGGTGGRVTSTFRELPVPGRRLHYGVDVAAPFGTPLLAPAAGIVRHALAQRDAPGFRGFGRIVTVELDETPYWTLLAHADTVSARPGQRVAPGEPLATVGSTGRSSVPHLHWEIRTRPYPAPKGGDGAIDPMLWYDARKV
jgi:murein DD-endopeptidase MepM/ murein hydrolase activator NlpD